MFAKLKTFSLCHLGVTNITYHTGRKQGLVYLSPCTINRKGLIFPCGFVRIALLLVLPVGRLSTPQTSATGALHIFALLHHCQRLHARYKRCGPYFAAPNSEPSG